MVDGRRLASTYGLDWSKTRTSAAIGYQRNMELVSNAYLYRYFLSIPSKAEEYMIIYGYPRGSLHWWLGNVRGGGGLPANLQGSRVFQATCRWFKVIWLLTVRIFQLATGNMMITKGFWRMVPYFLRNKTCIFAFNLSPLGFYLSTFLGVAVVQP